MKHLDMKRSNMIFLYQLEAGVLIEKRNNFYNITEIMLN